MKRAFDLFFATVGFVVLSPWFLVVGVAVWLSSPGPVLFRSRRVGRFGREFFLLKFRTMTRDAHLKGPPITIGDDHRITPLGAVLRRAKLDELPQLLNVIKGEMSLVGPRPEVPEYVKFYTPAQRRVLDLVPGMTDPASIKYALENDLLGKSKDPHLDYVNEIMPDKIRMNLGYAARANLWTDFLVILKTLVRIAQRPAWTDEGGEGTRGRRNARPTEETTGDMDTVSSVGVMSTARPASHSRGLTSDGRLVTYRALRTTGEEDEAVKAARPYCPTGAVEARSESRAQNSSVTKRIREVVADDGLRSTDDE
jgi:lipopolysaccharide/colanic/teichoic acid biosynthesis glycosyltransferase